MNCTSSNGRIDILGPNLDLRFAMSDKIPVNDCSSFRDSMTGNWTDTMLSDLFFSSQNIKLLQNGIKKGVYDKSKGQFVIGLQDCDELKIVMRSMFLQYSINNKDNITKQIEALNKIVLDYCVPQVYGEAQGYMQYKKDASTMWTPISRPVYSNTDSKTLELKHWF